MGDRFAFTVTYRDTELRTAMRGYLLRSLVENTWTSYVASLAVVIGVGLAVFARHFDFVTGLFTGIFLASLAALWAVAQGNARWVEATFASMRTPQASFTLTDDGVAVETDGYAGRCGWGRIRQVWKFDRVWLMMFSANRFLTLPLTGVPPEARNFIEAKVQARRL